MINLIAHIYDLTACIYDNPSFWDIVRFNECSLNEHTSASNFEEAFSALTFFNVQKIDQCPIQEYWSLKSLENEACQLREKDFADFSLNLSEAEKYDLDNIAITRGLRYNHCGNMNGFFNGSLSFFFKNLGNNATLSYSLAKITEKIAISIIGSNEETSIVAIDAKIGNGAGWHIDNDIENPYFIIAPLDHRGTLICKASASYKEVVFTYMYNDRVINANNPALDKCNELNSSDIYETDRYSALIITNNTIHSIPPVLSGGRAVFLAFPMTPENYLKEKYYTECNNV